MSISTVCRRCKQTVVADTDDELVELIMDHVRDHGGAGGKHVPSREHILAHAVRTPEGSTAGHGADDQERLASGDDLIG